MPFTVQDLLARVQPMRPDLDPGLIENMVQETAKRIMRESYLGHVVQSVVPIKGGTNEILLSSRVNYWDVTNNVPYLIPGGTLGLDSNQTIVPSNWAGSSPDAFLALDANPQQKTAAEPLRVIRVRFAPIPIQPPPISGGYLVLAGNQNLSAPPAAGTFLIMYGSATVTDPSTGIGYIVKTGDVMYSNGANWSLYPLEQFRTYRQVNGPTLNTNSNQPKFTNNKLVNCQQWSQRFGQIDSFYNSSASYTGMGGDVPVPGATPLITFFYPDGTTPLDTTITYGSLTVAPLPTEQVFENSFIPDATQVIAKSNIPITWSIAPQTLQAYGTHAPFSAVGQPFLSTDVINLSSHGPSLTTNVSLTSAFQPGLDGYVDFIINSGPLQTSIRFAVYSPA